jgi:WD40 repeat protein
MAIYHPPKRRKADPLVDERPTAINVLFNIDSQAFAKDIVTAKDDILHRLSTHISELQQALEAERDSRRAKFWNVPTNVIVANVFPFLENRKDWNNFSIVTKEIQNTVKNHKSLLPPWPDKCRLRHYGYNSLNKPTLNNPTFSPNGECIAYCENNHGNGSRIHIWCRKKGPVKVWAAHPAGQVSSLAYSPDGNFLTSCCHQGGVIKCWDVNNDFCCSRVFPVESVLSFAFSSDGKYIITGGFQQAICIWSVSDGSKVREVEVGIDCVWGIKFSPDCQTVAFCGEVVHNFDNDDIDVDADDDYNGFLGIWKLDGTEDTCVSLNGHAQLVTDLSFSPDGSILASASADHTIKLWESCGVRLSSVRTLEGHSEAVLSLCFSPDGDILASGSKDGLRLWGVAGGPSVCVDAGRWVHSVEFSADGRSLVTNEGPFSIFVRNLSA